MDFKVTNSFSRDNLNYTIGGVKNIHYGDIHTKFQTLFDITKEVVPFVNNDININRISDENYCKNGDIIFADASEDLNDVGKSIEIVNINDEKLLSGLHTLLARPKAGVFNLGFNGYLLKSNFVRTQIQKQSQGSKVLSVNTGRLLKIDLLFPSLQEQIKITLLLSLIDKRIQTQNKIIGGLRSLKSSVTVKIFSQEIRFNDEIDIKFGEWEERKFGEISDIKRGASPRPISNPIWFDKNCRIGWVRISDVTKSNKYLEKTEQYLSREGILKSRLVRKDNIIMSICATIGKPIYTKFDVCIHDGFVVFENPKINTEFLYYYLDYIQLNWYKYGQPGTQVNLNSEIVANENIPLPCLAEQQEIAKLLSSIDTKIDIENQLLQKLEDQKKFLLANLFI